MWKVAVIAALLATAVQPAVAAEQPSGKTSGKTSARCAPASAREAEAAIRYMTELMIVSSTCQDTVYAEFRLRNRDAILGYQKAMIAQMRGNAAFDRWNTALANQAAQRQAGNNQLCQQSAPLMQQAKGMDARAFRAYAAAQANAAAATCGGK